MYLIVSGDKISYIIFDHLPLESIFSCSVLICSRRVINCKRMYVVQRYQFTLDEAYNPFRDMAILPDNGEYKVEGISPSLWRL